jgi:hypothetical protein
MPHQSDSSQDPAASSLPRPPLPGIPKYSADLVAQICDIIRLDGLAEHGAGLLAGVSSATWSKWRREQPALQDCLEQARSEYQRERLARIREACGRDGAIDWRAQAYLLEKAHLHPEGKAPADAEAALSPLLVISPAQLALLQDRRAAALAKSKP